PRTGGLLTAVGALTAGPVGAAVGAVANAVFEKPLGRMGARAYPVTGPWKDPKAGVEGKAATPPDAAAKPVPRRESPRHAEAPPALTHRRHARTSCLDPSQPDPLMTQALEIAQSRLLLPAGLDVSGLERAFGALLGPGIDFGDLYFQHARRE